MKKITLIHLLLPLFCFLTFSLKGQLPADQVTKIDQLFANYNKPNAPGCMIGIIDDGELVYVKGFGMANVEKRIPFTSDTEFCIGSMTKQFTATCISLLVQIGKVNLDEDIRTYLPELTNFDQGISVRHLLHHTSGIRDYSTLDNLQGKTYKKFTTYQETLPLLQKQKALNFPPNTKHLYSNSGFLLLQEIVRRVSGQSLQQFAAEHIFEPLEMNQTFFNADFERITSDKTLSYRKDKSGNMVPWIEQSTGISNELIQTTLRDLLLWDQNFYHHRVGGAAVNKMLQTPVVLENGDTFNYAFGLALGTHSGLNYVTHGGGNLGYVSEMTRFPKQKKSIIILTNHPNVRIYPLIFRIADIVLAGDLKKTPPTKIEPVPTIQLAKSELKQYCGDYWSTAIDQHRVLYFRNDTLRYNRPDRYESPLVPIGNHTFKMLNGRNEQTASSIRFVLKPNGKNEYYFKTGDKPETYSYQFEPASNSKKYLKGFEGKFYGEEVGFPFEVKWMNKRLYMITDQKLRYRLHPIKADYFVSGSRQITFVRDEAGMINRFKLDLPRAKGLVFQKTD